MGVISITDVVSKTCMSIKQLLFYDDFMIFLQGLSDGVLTTNKIYLHTPPTLFFAKINLRLHYLARKELNSTKSLLLY